MATESSQPCQPTTDWQELVARKRRECQDKIPCEWTLSEDILKEVPQHVLEFDLPRRSGLFSDVELDVTENYTATDLLTKLASGQLSSLVVTTAFSKRAAIAQQVVSTIVEEYSLSINMYII
jgi:amidase